MRRGRADPDAAASDRDRTATPTTGARAGEDRPRHALVRRAVDEDEVEAEADRGEQRQAHSGRACAAALRRLARDEHDPRERDTIPTICSALGRSPVATPTTTGIAAETAEIGATTPIAPTAIPR